MNVYSVFIEPLEKEKQTSTFFFLTKYVVETCPALTCLYFSYR